MSASHARTTQLLGWVCLGFLSLGLTLPWVIGLAPFSLYRGALVGAIGDDALMSSRTLTFVLGMTGGSIAGKWLAHYAVVRLSVARSERSGLTACPSRLRASGRATRDQRMARAQRTKSSGSIAYRSRRSGA